LDHGRLNGGDYVFCGWRRGAHLATEASRIGAGRVKGNMESPINWRIVGHPLNWVTLFLMVFIAAIGAHFVLSHYTSLQNAVQGNQGQ
jgi:hypothetical protein